MVKLDTVLAGIEGLTGFKHMMFEIYDDKTK